MWLDDFVPTGMANGAWREFHVEGDVLGHKGFLGIEHHIPRDFLAGVSGGAGHHGHEGGGDHPVAGVQRVAVADGGVHFVVLGLVAVIVALVIVAGGPAPFQSIGIREHVVLAAAFSGVLGFAAEDAIPHAVFAVIHLAGEMVALCAVGP